jgi:hypothetical protein
VDDVIIILNCSDCKKPILEMKKLCFVSWLSFRYLVQLCMLYKVGGHVHVCAHARYHENGKVDR